MGFTNYAGFLNWQNSAIDTLTSKPIGSYDRIKADYAINTAGVTAHRTWKDTRKADIEALRDEEAVS